MKKKTTIILCVCLVVCLGLLWLLQALLMPKYMGKVKEGALIGEYYQNAGNNDVIFVGDCEVYENISPVTLWEEYGISSYVRGSPQQLIWHSYYLMEETLRYEKPEAFVFNVLSMKYGEPQSEAYNRLALDGMKWSSSKSDAIVASMTDEEEYISYLFPLLRFHSRWSELTAEDFRYAFQEVPKLSINGYLMRIDVDGVEELRTGQAGKDAPIADVCWEYLDKMRTLCQQNGVELILMKAPTNTPQWYWYESWDQAVREYAQEHGLRYYNFLDNVDEIGIDYTTDTYDQGGHLNLSGAEKLSKYFGKIMTEELELTDHRGDAVYEQTWTVLCDQYDQIRQTQEKLLKENGKLTGFTGLE